MLLRGASMLVLDMPKLERPFVRKFNEKNEYVCVPEIDARFKWVFSDECVAVEKLDGTNVSIFAENRSIIGIYNRKNSINVWKKGNKRFVDGILETIEREYFKMDNLADGQYFGELIGELVNGNPYLVRGHLWLPFNFLQERLQFKFWNDFVKDLQDLNDFEIYNKTRNIFKGLWSLYKRKKGMQGTVDETFGFEGLAAEGIVFYRKGTNEMAKLRRDMFDFFKGRRHE